MLHCASLVTSASIQGGQAFMDHARRWLMARRTRLTTFVHALRWKRASVAGLAWRTVVRALCIFIGSLLDALLTLGHLASGGAEANPVLALALAHSIALFLQVKIVLTGVSVCVLAAHEQVPLAARSLHGLTLGYGILLVYHLLLGLRWV